MGYGWAAVSPGLVKEFLKANSVTASFTGDNVNFAVTPQEAANLWSPIDTRPSAELGYYCPTGLFYRSRFRWNLGKLAPGTYNLLFFGTLRHPVADGTASCVDDQGHHFPNIMYSGTNDTESTVTITQ